MLSSRWYNHFHCLKTHIYMFDWNIHILYTWFIARRKDPRHMMFPRRQESLHRLVDSFVIDPFLSLSYMNKFNWFSSSLLCRKVTASLVVVVFLEFRCWCLRTDAHEQQKSELWWIYNLFIIFLTKNLLNWNQHVTFLHNFISAII